MAAVTENYTLQPLRPPQMRLLTERKILVQLLSKKVLKKLVHLETKLDLKTGFGNRF